MYKPGQWKMVCDVCGFEYYNRQMKERWDGAWVCHADFETRHPQEFGRTVIDEQSVPYSRPEPTDIFINVYYIDDPVAEGEPEPELPPSLEEPDPPTPLPIGPSSSVAGAAIAGYAISGALT